MTKIKRFAAIIFLSVIALCMDTLLFLVKKIKGNLYFPGG